MNYQLEQMRQIEKEVSGKIYPCDLEVPLYRHGFEQDLKIINGLDIKFNRALDFGCGRGYLAVLLALPFWNVEGVDIEPKDDSKDIEPSGPIYFYQRAVWNKFEKEFPNVKFYLEPEFKPYQQEYDLIVCYAVLEHIPFKELKRTLLKLKLMLNENGFLYIARTPREYSMAEMFVESHHRRFTKKGITELLNECGFEIVSYQETDLIPAFSIFKFLSSFSFGYFFLVGLEKVLIHTPLKYLAHHMRIIARKK